jgi:hypothetical protein
MKTIVIEWSAVKRRFVDSVRHRKPWNQAKQDALLVDPYAVDDWQGGSLAQTLSWLDDGFYAPELQAAADLIPVSPKVRVGWSEEDGDIDVGRLYGGYDDYMLEVSPSETRPGLRVTADAFFAASVNPSTVKAYGAWVAGLIGSLETGGYDLGVSIGAPVDELYEGKCPRTRVEMTVKRPGEMSDFTEWSAIFAPTGLRHLFFTAFGVAAESVGKQQTSFMCMTLDRKASDWGVSYDPDTNHLHITVNQRDGGKFPAERMNEMLAQSGLI